MDISNCVFSLFYQPIPSIRREVFDIEDKLDGYLKPFQIYSIPDDAPFELPRISAITENGHSTLNIAAQSAQVQSRFDERYSKDFAKSLDYSKVKAQELYRTLSAMPSIQLHFSGLIVQIFVPTSEIEESPVDFINNTYLRATSRLPMSDAMVKLVYKVDNDTYLNIEVQRMVLSEPISISIAPNSVSVLKKPQANNPEVLSVSIDLNNRLAFNEGRILGCDNTMIEYFYSRMQMFLENEIDSFLKNGEVKF